MTKLIFLDIDGVLNSRDANAHHFCGIHADKIALLNRIVERTGAEVVISSAWRYMILGGAMTIDGFRYMLMTHGLASFVRLVGCTVPDEEIPERGDQISAFLDQAEWPPYVVLDDGSELPQTRQRSMTDSLIARHAKRWVKVDGAVGLTLAEVDHACNLLGAATML